MPAPAPKASRILAAIKSEVRRQGTNPYQIARASGLPLTTVQRLLASKASTQLRNVETLIEALGLEFSLIPGGTSKVKPGTGRGHGLPVGKRRSRG